jgi:hypothetical protein
MSLQYIVPLVAEGFSLEVKASELQPPFSPEHDLLAEKYLRLITPIHMKGHHLHVWTSFTRVDTIYMCGHHLQEWTPFT